MDCESESEIPVVIIGYNRPDFLENQINLVCEKRKLVYVFVDGPKDKNDLGAIRSAEIAISKGKMHDLRVKVSKTNLGCRKSIPAAINWVLQSHKSLIVLEDDIEPSNAFFDFMDYCLDNFAERKDVFQVSGWTPNLFNSPIPPAFLSRHAFCWGWGTWRDKWEKANIELEGIDYEEELRLAIKKCGFKTNKIFFNIWRERLALCAKGKDTWDYQWYLSIWMNRGKSIVPSKSLTSNIGFDERATRTQSAPKYLSAKESEQTNREYLSSCLSYMESQVLLSDPKWDRRLDHLLLDVRTGNSIRDLIYNFSAFTLRQIKKVGFK